MISPYPDDEYLHLLRRRARQHGCLEEVDAHLETCGDHAHVIARKAYVMIATRNVAILTALTIAQQSFS